MNNILHFDTINSNYDPSLNDPFRTSMILSNPIAGVRSINLKSIELPIGFFNVRVSGTLNQVTISLNNVNYTITLVSKNYTTISSLCTDINTAFTSVNFGVSTTVTFTASGNYVNVSITSTGITQFSIVNTLLSQYVLGLRSTNTAVIASSTSATISSTNIWNLGCDNYLNMFLENIPVGGNSNHNGKLCSFKISLNGVNGMVMFNNDENLFKQSVHISDEYYILREMKVVMYDRFGNNLSNNGLDYSFSLGFTFH